MSWVGYNKFHMALPIESTPILNGDAEGFLGKIELAHVELSIFLKALYVRLSSIADEYYQIKPILALSILKLNLSLLPVLFAYIRVI